MSAPADHEAIEPNAYAIAFRLIGDAPRSRSVAVATADFVSSIGGIDNPYWLAESAAEAVRLSLIEPPADGGDVQLRVAVRRRLAAATPVEVAAASLHHLAGYPIADVATALQLEPAVAAQRALLLSPPPGSSYRHLGDQSLIGDDAAPVRGTASDHRSRRRRLVRNAAVLLVVLALATMGAALSVGDRPTLTDNTVAADTPATTSTSTSVPVSDGCSTATPTAPGTSEQPIAAGSGSYRLATPDPGTGGPGTPRPLIVAVPGFGQTAASFQQASQLEATATASGFVVATYDPATPDLEVNAGEDPTRPDDLAGVSMLLDDVLARQCIDRSQVHVAGLGPGARLSTRLACARPADIASVVADAGGSIADDCFFTPPVSLFLVWSGNDDVMPVGGGYGPALAAVAPAGADRARPPAEGAEALASRWATGIGAGQNSRSAESDGTLASDWTDAANGAAVRLVISPTGGHAWAPTTTDSLLEFVEAHQRNG